MKPGLSKQTKGYQPAKAKKIVMVGAEGVTGLYLLDELLKKDYHVTAITQEKFPAHLNHKNLKVVMGDIYAAEEMVGLLKGNYAAISAIEPTYINSEEYVEAIYHFVQEVKKAMIKRIIVIGHPIMSAFAKGNKFYESWRPIAIAQKDVLKLLTHEMTLEWTFLHTAYLESDKRTGFYPVSNRVVISNSWGESEKELTGNYINAILERVEINEVIMEGNEIDI